MRCCGVGHYHGKLYISSHSNKVKENCSVKLDEFLKEKNVTDELAGLVELLL